jgi:hypothetical protein
MLTSDNGSVLCSPPARTTKDLSAAERCAQMDALIAHLNAVTRQVNAVTAECVTLRSQHEALADRAQVAEDMAAAHGAWHLNHTVSFLARLRWLVLGR